MLAVYQMTWHQIPEERNSECSAHKNFESHIASSCYMESDTDTQANLNESVTIYTNLNVTTSTIIYQDKPLKCNKYRDMT
jgi:hypothetical protein